MKTKTPAILTTGNPAKRIVIFTLPLLAGELIGIVYTMTDAFIVSRWVGINGLAAVGIASSIVQFVFSFIIGITTGFTVITAQRIGAAETGGGEEGIRRSTAAGFFLCFAASIVLSIVIIPFIKPLLGLMKTPLELMQDASTYVFVISCGIIVFVFYFQISGIIYSGGDSFSPLVFYATGIIANIILDILFVAVYSWGVMGAAAATVLSEIIVLILSLNFLLKRFGSFIPGKKEWFPGKHELKSHLSLGLAIAFQRCIVDAGNILIQAAINSLGALSIAAVSAAQRIRALNMMPLFALSRAVTTYSAQNYGSGKIDRINKGLFQSCMISLCLGIFMAGLNRFTGTPLLRLFFQDNHEALVLAERYIQITGYTVFLLGIMLVFRSTLQGMGMRKAPVICGIMETLMSIFAAFALIPHFGFLGVCLVNPLSWFVSGIPLLIAFAVRRKKQI